MKRFNLLSLILLVSIITSLLSTTLISAIEDFSHIKKVVDFEVKTDKSMSFLEIYLKEKGQITKIAQDEFNKGENTVVLPTKATIIALDKENFSKKIDIMQNINGIIDGIAVALCVWAFILILQIIFLFRREKVFEELNIKRCSKIGMFCIIIGLLETFINISNAVMATKVAELKFYNISYSHTIEWTTIIIGLIILVFTEILRISTTIKQEQDLTI